MSTTTSECNSAGRVSRCQRDCRRFESGHSLHFFCSFSKHYKKIIVKIINLKVASKLALEIFHFYLNAFCMEQKA